MGCLYVPCLSDAQESFGRVLGAIGQKPVTALVV